MKFRDLTSCPFCGHDEYYTKEYVCGTLNYRERFDGEETENGEMYDGLNCRGYSGRAYCRKCERYLGNRETNEVSKQVLKALAERNKK